MRNLTIKRTKSFVGCLGTFKVYIADANSYETVIHNIPCRKLGDLKNGEEKTFLIDENPTRIFVIAGNMSKNYCSDFYDIPMGSDDVYLSGKSRFNPANGNAFRFDGVTNPEVLENRKQGNRIGLLIVSAAIIIGLIIGIVIGLLRIPKGTGGRVFSDSGMRITLTKDFYQISIPGYTACYNSENVAIFTLKEEFELLDGSEDYTIRQYGELVVQNNSLSVAIQNSNGLTYFEYFYRNPSNGESYQYIAFVYKADDAFWLVQFATLSDDFDEYRGEIMDWAGSVKFS